MKQAAGGMVLLELLLAISVAGLISAAGFRAFASIGEILHRRNQAQVETARISGLEARFRQAWNGRISHRFQAEPWLLVEGLPGSRGSWPTLRRLRLKTAGADGSTGWWELNASLWGRIEVNSAALGEWLPGTSPTWIQLRFPGAKFRQNQIGFAVSDNWP